MTAAAKCDRCPNVDDLSQVLEWHLCPPCRYDAFDAVRKQVFRGRHTSAVRSWGARLEECARIIRREGEVTADTLAHETGLDRRSATYYLHRTACRGGLKRIEKGRYTLPSTRPRSIQGRKG